MDSFETRKVSELELHKNRPQNDTTSIAFAGLPETLAMFVPRGKCSTISTRRTSTYTKLRTKFPDRQISTAADKEKDGVWFWWNPTS